MRELWEFIKAIATLAFYALVGIGVIVMLGALFTLGQQSGSLS